MALIYNNSYPMTLIIHFELLINREPTFTYEQALGDSDKKNLPFGRNLRAHCGSWCVAFCLYWLG